MWEIEIAQRWVELLPTWGWTAVLGAAVAAGAVALQRRIGTWAGAALLGVCALIGAAELWRRLSLVDDAFISFRYARNLLQGEGLVHNPGEWVLGITNLGWTLGVAALSAVSGLEIPHAGLLASALAWVALIGFTWRASRALHGARAFPPLAACLVAVSWPVASFGSTGLESLGATALVVGGLDALLRGRFTLAGLLLVLAAIFRLDHGLFLGLGAIAAWRTGGLARFLAPSPLLAATLAWTWWTYGEPLPNTVHAKGAGAYWSQGGVYLLTFWLSTHLLWQIPLILWGALHWATAPAFRWMVVPALGVWNLYIAYVGGDFMVARFLLPCIPLALLAVEQAVGHASGWRAVALAAWMGTAAYGLPIVTARHVEWYQADEGTVYPVVRVHPLEIDHHSFYMGKALHSSLTSRGLRPVISVHGLGMISYYSELPVVDFLGLTDPVTARSPLPEGTRRRPGHEKRATPEHLIARGVTLAQFPPWPPREPVTRLRPTAEAHALRRWHLWRWDPELSPRMRAAAPELGLPDLPTWVQDRLDALPDTPPAEVREDLALLDKIWYGQPGVDPSTRARFVEATR